MKYKFIFILSFLMTLLVVNVMGACITPVENLNVNESMTLCVGNYNLNDSDANGVLIINASNIVLDCNGTIFIGNYTTNSRVIYPTNRNNVTFKNCNIFNYNYGIRIYGGSNSSYLNNNISNVTIGLYSQFTNGLNIYNNSILDNRSVASTQGISLDSSNNNTLVYNNFINTYFYQIFLQGQSNNVSIYNNYLTNAKGSNTARSIETRMMANNTRIYNNTIINPDRNGIVVASNLAYIYNNFVTGYLHHGIDISCGVSPLNGSNIYVYNNNITNPIDNGVGSTGIVVCDSRNISVYNNNIYNVFNTYASTKISGVSVDILGNSSNITIYDNSFTNLTGYYLHIKGNSTWHNNTLDTGVRAWYFLTYTTYFVNVSLLNNNYLDGIVNYVSGSDYINITINDSSIVNSSVYLSNSGRINFLYNGLKNFNLYNSTFNLFNQLSQSPYNDVKNTSTNTILSSNVDNFSITLKANQGIEVGNFTSLSVAIPSYPSGNVLTSDVTIVTNVSDPDSVFNFTRAIIYDDNLNIVQSQDNSSLNSLFTFENLTNQSSYYFRVFVFTDQGTYISTMPSAFRMGNTYGVADCTTNEHSLWLLVPLIILAGFLLWLWTAVEGGLFKDISFIVVLVIIINLIINLISVVKLGC